MIGRTITALLLIIALIHLLPVIGILGGERLASLYGVEIADSNLEVLMRHRAMLFGVLGFFFTYAAFRPAIQPIAFLAAFASVASFLFLSFSTGDLNDAIWNVVIADLVALAALFAAVVLYIVKRSRSQGRLR